MAFLTITLALREQQLMSFSVTAVPTSSEHSVLTQ